MKLLQDEIWLAFRAVRARPAFALLVILTLAVGIGANTAIFSMVDAVLFRQLRGVHRPKEIYRIFNVPDDKSTLLGIPYPAFTELRGRSRALSGIAAFNNWSDVDFSVPGRDPERVHACLVSGNFFDLLGVQPERGTLIKDSGDHIRESVVVLSDAFWRARFAAAENVIGSEILLNNHPFTIIGIAPADFAGVSLDARTDVWAPIQAIGALEPRFAEYLQSYDLDYCDVVGRLRDGAKPDEAQTELRAIGSSLAAWQEKRPHTSITLKSPLQALDWDAPHSSRASWALVGMAVLVLAMSCAVAAGLLLLRGEQRRHEISVRLALGASRSRILRQVLMECLFLAGAAVVAGMFLASWMAHALILFTPDKFPIPFYAASSSVLDPRMLRFTIAVSFLSAIAFGLVPAVRASRFPLPGSLQSATGSAASRRLLLQRILLIVQVAFCTALLAGAGLLLRTLWNANRVEAGFSPDHVFEASLDLSKEGYSKETGTVFYARLLQKIGTIPRISDAGLARAVPVGRFVVTTGFQYGLEEPINGHGLRAEFNVASPGYFKTIGIYFLRGRNFDGTDTSDGKPVVVINQTMAQRYWPGQNPVGTMIHLPGSRRQMREIVGVVSDAKYRSLREPVAPMLYVPLSQSYSPNMTLIVRTAGNPAEVLPALKQAVSELNPRLPLISAGTLRQKVADSLAPERLLALLFCAFGGLALLLATGGLYSVISYSVQLRTQEIGIRIALGASKRDARSLVLLQGLSLTLIGILAGVSFALAGSRLIASFLFGIGSTDPVTYSAIVLILMGTSMIACYVPAHRASRVDPIKALRYE